VDLVKHIEERKRIFAFILMMRKEFFSIFADINSVVEDPIIKFLRDVQVMFCDFRWRE
jgi:hypothetical protein